MKETSKNFDAVAFMRKQRNRISNKLSGMSKEEVMEYLQKLRSEIKLINTSIK